MIWKTSVCTVYGMKKYENISAATIQQTNKNKISFLLQHLMRFVGETTDYSSDGFPVVNLLLFCRLQVN
jgi:hypothetical protein